MFQGGTNINEQREHTGKTLNFVEIAWGIFWMVAGGMLFITSEAFTIVTTWSDNPLVASFLAFAVMYVIMSICWILAIKIAGFAKPRLMRMFWHDVEVLRENNQKEEAREE